MLLLLLLYGNTKQLAKTSAEQRQLVAMDDSETATRLAAAQASMEQQLVRVNKEKANLELAVADLQRAKVQLDQEAAQANNLGKPAALAAVLLFSVRSIMDLVAAMSSSSGSSGLEDGQAHMTAAIIQGALALAGAAYLLVSKK